jgi:hypothetical protein
MVAFFLEVGLLLIVLPWSSFWDRNYFAYAWPGIRPLLTNNFVRGAVSGLGVLNLVAAFAELMPIFSRGDRQDVPGGRMPDSADSRIEP